MAARKMSPLPHHVPQNSSNISVSESTPQLYKHTAVPSHLTQWNVQPIVPEPAFTIHETLPPARHPSSHSNNYPANHPFPSAPSDVSNPTHANTFPPPHLTPFSTKHRHPAHSSHTNPRPEPRTTAHSLHALLTSVVPQQRPAPYRSVPPHMYNGPREWKFPEMLCLLQVGSGSEWCVGASTLTFAAARRKYKKRLVEGDGDRGVSRWIGTV